MTGAKRLRAKAEAKVDVLKAREASPLVLDRVPLHGVRLKNSIKKVTISDAAKKDLRRVPGHVADKLEAWTRAVVRFGLEQVRKIPGYHDEPLKGDRKGQRSIRLSKLWRAIYVIAQDGSARFVSIESIIPHNY